MQISTLRSWLNDPNSFRRTQLSHTSKFHEGTGSSHEKFDAWPGPNINGMKMVTWFSSPAIVYDVFQRFLFIFGRFETFILTFFITQESV